jgi:hypothetical protein
MEIDLAVLADAATVDMSGKLNILGIFDRISVGELPAHHPHLSLVLRLSASMGEAGSHKMEIVLRDPEGGRMMGMNGEFHVGPGPAVSGGQVRIPQVLNIERLVFQKSGRYAFDVSLDGEHHASIPLFVHEMGSPRSGAKA